MASAKSVRWWTAVAPVEWVLLAFLAYALARVTAWRADVTAPAIPRLDVVCTFLGIVTFRALMRYRSIRWRPEQRSAAIRHYLVLPALLTPALVLLVFGRERWPDIHESERAVEIVLLARAWGTHAAQLLIPPILLWLVTGIQVKNDGTLSVARLLQTSGRGALQTIRDWAPPVILIFGYPYMNGILMRPLVADRDAELFAIDHVLALGHDPVLAVQHIATPLLSEIMALAYVSYALFFPVVLGAIYALGTRVQFREAAFATTLALAVGYLLYTFVPAQGPLFTLHYESDLTDYTLRGIQHQLMDRRRVPRDCFPSLHTCMSWLLAQQAWRSARPVFWIIMPFAALIPLSCVYLRYHYMVDVLAGMALAAIVALVSRRLMSRGAFE